MTSTIDKSLNEETVRLAVTGLSRAGKTVFITALVQNLLALGQGANTLPKFARRLAAHGETRIRSIQLLPAGAATIPHFDQNTYFRSLAAEMPNWPARTEDLAQLTLAIEVDRRSSVGHLLGRRRVRLEILDYPGEWLLDLPLLDLTYADWSERTLKMLDAEPRRAHAARFLAFLERSGDVGQVIDETLIREGHELYRNTLLACRAEHGLRYLQPGRFVCPGPRSEAPFMWFFPAMLNGATARRNTMGALLAERFETYKRDMRESFFDRHFAAFDRQAVLVDVLGAIYAGRAAFEDTVRAVREIGDALRYGTRSLPRMIAASVVRRAGQVLPSFINRATGPAAHVVSGSRIERVAFVATKADHVPKLRRDNLLNLVRAFARATGAGAHQNGAQVSYHVAAAVLSTEDGTARFGDRPVEVVRGIKLGEETVRPFYVGDVPSSLPPESFWKDRYFEMPVFRPPPIDPSGLSGVAHLHLDQVLDELIGDLL